MVISIDIETGFAPHNTIQNEVTKKLMDLKPPSKKPYNSRLKDPLKIEEDREKKDAEYNAALLNYSNAEEYLYAECKSKSALWNSAKILCIGCCFDSLMVNFSICPLNGDERIGLMKSGIIPLTYSSEKEMLIGFQQTVDAIGTDDNVIVGFNSWNFDFPKLRLAARRNGVNEPLLLTRSYKYNQVDVMRLFVSRYNCESKHACMISLAKVCAELDIPFAKNEAFSGKDVPEAFENSEYLKIIKYNMPDAAATLLAYHILR